jgi:hypothetical protein
MKSQKDSIKWNTLRITELKEFQTEMAGVKAFEVSQSEKIDLHRTEAEAATEDRQGAREVFLTILPQVIDI